MASVSSKMPKDKVENGDAIVDTEPDQTKDQASTEPSLRQKIIKQVEFYFSDSNIINDDFLLDLVTKDTEGWVNLAIISGFNKMKKLTTSLDEIVDALAESKFVEVSSSRDRVRRIDPLPEKDPNFERKVLILSAIPEQEIKKIKQIELKFAEVSNPCKNVRCFPPFNNVSKDLKSAFNRHRLPEKKFYMVEFDDIDKASAGLRHLRNWWPTAYSNLLSWKSGQAKTNLRIPNGDNSGSNAKASKKQPLEPLIKTTERPRLKILMPDPNKPVVVLKRQPYIPPAEESVGFEANWKEKLREKQLIHRPPADLNSSKSDCFLSQSTSTSCDFEDPAVVNYVK